MTIRMLGGTLEFKSYHHGNHQYFLGSEYESGIGNPTISPPAPRIISCAAFQKGHFIPQRVHESHHPSSLKHNPYHHKHWAKFYQSKQLANSFVSSLTSDEGNCPSV